MPTRGPAEEKPQTDRVRECLAILSKIINDLEIPPDNPSIVLLKKRMGTYWRDGRLQEDKIPLVGSNRYIMYRFPRWSHQIVEITLRVAPITFQSLPSGLEEEASR